MPGSTAVRPPPRARLPAPSQPPPPLPLAPPHPPQRLTQAPALLRLPLPPLAIPLRSPPHPLILLPPTPTSHVNPFARTVDLTPQRIDMGVDYDGAGEIDAIGDARVTFAGTGIGGGWTCSTKANGGVVYQLINGPDHGRYVYVAEDIVP